LQTNEAPSHRTPRRVRAIEAAMLAGFAAYAAHIFFGLGAPGADLLFERYVYLALILVPTVLVLARVPGAGAERIAWLLIGLGLATTAFAECYYAIFLADAAIQPYPSIADAGWLTTYPLWLAGLVLLVRARAPRFRNSLWLDSAIGALSLGSAAALFALPAIINGSGGALAANLTSAAYPVGDIMLIAFVAGILMLAGWRREASWGLLAAGLIVAAVGDTVYEYQAATGTYAAGMWLDLTWPLSAMLIGFAAWRRSPGTQMGAVGGWRASAAPVGLAVIAIGVLVYGYAHKEAIVASGDTSQVAVGLAAAALLLIAVRMAFTYWENLNLARQVQTDPLTGLGNRGKLLLDLHEATAIGTEQSPLALVMFDLDGFKLYNDTFGHAAGDALLRRMASRLAAVMDGSGSAYRVGGDEFCILIAGDLRTAGDLTARALAALTEQGGAFAVTASYGSAAIPGDCADGVQALKLADERMYLRKNGSRASARNQAQQVLLRTLRERQPELSRHTSNVSALAALIAPRFTSNPEELDVILRSATLHDIGKLAIPDALLAKPDPMSDEEVAFIRSHTEIGDRILRAAPALAPVAKIVRSSHERWDGAGYPDRLAGEEIPLGSRIIFVCDAFDAMTNKRPYSAAMPAADAIDELRAHAGTQFDPTVVSVACEVLKSARPSEQPPTGESAAGGQPSLEADDAAIEHADVGP
jgi:two-component system cell cycle response regulator